MSIWSEISRRHFLLDFTQLSLLAFLNPFMVFKDNKSIDKSYNLAKKLTALFRHKIYVSELGKEYLKFYHQEKDLDKLVNAVATSSKIIQNISPLSNLNKVRQSVLLQIKRDFETNETVQIHGWVLSLTEARLYALTYLISQKTVKASL